jgi:hypothetical protein
MSLTTPLRAVSRDVESAGELMARLRPLALRSLGRMYRPDERLFVFRVRAAGRDVVAEGLSRRYSAISVIGMAEDQSVNPPAVLGGA